IMETRIDSFPGRRMPPSTVITGVDGGHDVDIRSYAADGVVVLGRLAGVAEGRIILADDAEVILAEADKTYTDFTVRADNHIRTAAFDMPEQEDAGLPSRSSAITSVAMLDLESANINSVIWATGYAFDFGWLHVPVLDARGAPVQERGVTGCPNLYF